MSRSDGAAPRLLDCWPDVAARIRAGGRLALFLDFDGTLVRIARRPELVRLPAFTRRMLKRLAAQPRVTVAVISGRRRAELLRHVGLRRIHYFGVYGWERSSHSPLPKATRAALRRVAERLEDRLSGVPGIWIEYKYFSASVHLLEVPANYQESTRAALRSILRSFGKALRLIENLRDVEIVPRSVPGKGTAVRELMSTPALRKALPFYFGDDLSDESAFAAVGQGISVQVGAPRPTSAKFSARDPAEVARILRKLHSALQP